LQNYLLRLGKDILITVVSMVVQLGILSLLGLTFTHTITHINNKLTSNNNNKLTLQIPNVN
jgi:hypothetical protein